MNLHARTHVLDFSSLDTWKGYMTEKTSFTCPCVLLNLKKIFCFAIAIYADFW